MSEFNLRDFFESPHNYDSRGQENGNFELLNEQSVDSQGNVNDTIFELTEQTRPWQRENTVGWRYDVNVKDHVIVDTLQFDHIRDKSSTQRKGIRELSPNLEPVRINLNNRLMDQSQTNLSNVRNYNEQTCCTNGTNNWTVTGARTQTEFQRPDNFKGGNYENSQISQGSQFQQRNPNFKDYTFNTHGSNQYNREYVILRYTFDKEMPLCRGNQPIPGVERENVIPNRQGDNIVLRNRFEFKNSPVNYECQNDTLNPYHTEIIDRGPCESIYRNHITPHRHEPQFPETRNASFQSQNTSEQIGNSQNSQHDRLTGVNAHETNTNYGTHLGPKSEHFPVSGQLTPQRQIPRKQKDPDTYDGKHVEWLDYICHLEQVALWNCWSENEIAAQLAMSLRGSAQRALSEITRDELFDYAKLKFALTQRFCPPERETAFRCEFRNRRRKREESVAEYGYALKRLATRAFPSIPLGVRESLIIEQYISGLGDAELKRHVHFRIQIH
ncbi:unnamed protein product [Mytilus coruscus]|uniref:Retrotransposon gag domain-containing protein n=1 Tax=Mytilus coruscus TaxID=42192 RepID=A0A6J8BGJ1_MYTCO|nr:unnamed protein product [Mytilus coruscus]